MKVKCRLFLVISLVGLMATPILGCAPTVSPAPAPEPAPPEEEIQVEEPTQTVVEAEALERYDFAIEALEIWEEIKAISFDAFEILSALDDPIPADCSEVINLINRHYQLEYRLKWLYAPPDTLEMKDSLLQELDLINACIIRISVACNSRDEGNEVQYQRFTREAADLFAEFVGKEGLGSRKIERDLINLRLQAEKDLKLR